MAKKSENQTKNTKLEVKETVNTSGALSTVLEDFEEVQETFPFLVPTVDIPVVVCFVDGKVFNTKIGKDTMPVTKVFDAEDGTVKLLGMKAVLLKHFAEKEGSTIDEKSKEGTIPVEGLYYKITMQAKKSAKEGGKQYSPYLVSQLIPKKKK